MTKTKIIKMECRKRGLSVRDIRIPSNSALAAKRRSRKRTMVLSQELIDQANYSALKNMDQATRFVAGISLSNPYTRDLMLRVCCRRYRTPPTHAGNKYLRFLLQNKAIIEKLDRLWKRYMGKEKWDKLQKKYQREGILDNFARHGLVQEIE